MHDVRDEGNCWAVLFVGSGEGDGVGDVVARPTTIQFPIFACVQRLSIGFHNLRFNSAIKVASDILQRSGAPPDGVQVEIVYFLDLLNGVRTANVVWTISSIFSSAIARLRILGFGVFKCYC